MLSTFQNNFLSFGGNGWYSAGGLVTAVAPIVIRCHGQWVGWTGDCQLNEEQFEANVPESSSDDNSPTAGLTNSQVE